MAAFVGKDGSVAWTSHTSLADNQAIKQWTLDIKVDEHDVTDFSVTQWRSFIAGLSGATGSFTGFVNSATTPTIAEIYGAAANLVLTLDSSRSITVSAFVTGVTFGNTADGVATYTCTFRVTGAPSFA